MSIWHLLPLNGRLGQSSCGPHYVVFTGGFCGLTYRSSSHEILVSLLLNYKLRCLISNCFLGRPKLNCSLIVD